MSTRGFVLKAFKYPSLPADNPLKAFLKLSIDLTNEDELLDAISKQLQGRTFKHEGTARFSATSFWVLIPTPLKRLLATSHLRSLKEEDISIFLKGLEAHLMNSFRITSNLARQVTK